MEDLFHLGVKALIQNKDGTDVGLILLTYFCKSNTPAHLIDDEHQTIKWCSKEVTIKLLSLKFASSLLAEIQKL